MTERKLRIFLCHSSSDKFIVRDLYQRLESEAWIDPWLDEEKLLPGQDWDMEIEKAVEASDAVIVCLSNKSVSKEGYIQRELKFALDIALEKPEGAIFIIPLKLDDCDLPRRLRSWQYVDYFPAGQKEKAYQRLLQSLKLQYKQKFSSDVAENEIVISKPEIENIQYQDVKISKVATMKPEKASIFDSVGLLFFLSYFVIEFIIYLNDRNPLLDYSKLIFATLSGLYFIVRKQLPNSPSFKIMVLIYMFLYPPIFYLTYTGPIITLSWTLLMISSILVVGSLVTVLRASGEKIIYASVALGTFLLFVGAQTVAQFLDVYDLRIISLQFIASVATAVFMWKKL